MDAPLWIDTTLRDGIQAPGAHPDLEARRLFFPLLLRLGITSVEAGIPAQGPGAQNFLNWCAEAGPEAEIIAWCRLTEKDVEAALATRASTVHIAFPSGPAYGPFRKDPSGKAELTLAKKLLRRIVSDGRRASLGAEDAPNTEPEALRALFLEAQDAGACRVRYADSLGSMTPTKVLGSLPPLTHELEIPLEFHGHNDFGFASANALCAWEAGARAVSGTIGGIGERGGHTALEEVAAALEVSGIRSGFQWELAQEAALAAATLTGMLLSPHKPIVGEKIFTHAAGLHQTLVLRGGRVTALPPELVGRRHALPLSPQSGKSALAHHARERGKDLDERESETLATAWRRTWDFAPSGTDPETVFSELLEALHA